MIPLKPLTSVISLTNSFTHPEVCGGTVNSALPRRLSVRDPSSMIRMVMVPNLKVSPALTGTKLMGTVGVSIFSKVLERVVSVEVWGQINGKGKMQWSNGQCQLQVRRLRQS